MFDNCFTLFKSIDRRKNKAYAYTWIKINFINQMRRRVIVSLEQRKSINDCAI